ARAPLFPYNDALPISEVEPMLARLLQRANDPQAAAAMNEATWKRLGNTPEGREAGRRAAQQYYSFNNADGWTKAAMLSDDMLDRSEEHTSELQSLAYL